VMKGNPVQRDKPQKHSTSPLVSEIISTRITCGEHSLPLALGIFPVQLVMTMAKAHSSDKYYQFLFEKFQVQIPAQSPTTRNEVVQSKAGIVP